MASTRFAPGTLEADTAGAAAAPMSSAHRRLGLWSCRAGALFAVGFGIGAVLDRLPFVPDPWGPIAAYAPSLALALVVPLALVAVHHVVLPSRAVWSHAALVFVTMYAVLATITYATQMLVVEPHRAQGRLADVALLEFTDKSFLMIIDTTGYFLLSVGLLLLAPALSGEVAGGIEVSRAVRWFAIANGVLAPVYLAAIWVPPLLALGVLWLVAVPAQMWLMARIFRGRRSAAVA